MPSSAILTRLHSLMEEKGERRVRHMSEFWRARGYQLNDLIGHPSGHVGGGEEPPAPGRIGRVGKGVRTKVRDLKAGDHITANIYGLHTTQPRRLLSAKLSEPHPNGQRTMVVTVAEHDKPIHIALNSAVNVHQMPSGTPQAGNVPPWGAIERVPGGKWRAHLPGGSSRIFSSEAEAQGAWHAANGTNVKPQQASPTARVPQATVPRDATYRSHYERGWKASSRPYSGNGPSPLERADDRGESDAWYHGYHDYAAGREKWATPSGLGEEQVPHEAVHGTGGRVVQGPSMIEPIPGKPMRDFRDPSLSEQEASDMVAEYARQNGFVEHEPEWTDFERWTSPDGTEWDMGYDDPAEGGTGHYIVTPRGSWNTVASSPSWRDAWHQFLTMHGTTIGKQFSEAQGQKQDRQRWWEGMSRDAKQRHIAKDLRYAQNNGDLENPKRRARRFKELEDWYLGVGPKASDYESAYQEMQGGQPDIAKMEAAPAGTKYHAYTTRHGEDGELTGGATHTWTKGESGRWHKGSADKRGGTAQEIHAMLDNPGAGTTVHYRGFQDVYPFDSTLPNGKPRPGGQPVLPGGKKTPHLHEQMGVTEDNLTGVERIHHHATMAAQMRQGYTREQARTASLNSIASSRRDKPEAPKGEGSAVSTPEPKHVYPTEKWGVYPGGDGQTGEGMPTSLYMAAEQRLGGKTQSGRPSIRSAPLREVDRYARSRRTHDKLPASMAALDKALEQQGVGRDEHPRKAIRDWYGETFTDQPDVGERIRAAKGGTMGAVADGLAEMGLGKSRRAAEVRQSQQAAADAIHEGQATDVGLREAHPELFAGQSGTIATPEQLDAVRKMVNGKLSKPQKKEVAGLKPAERTDYYYRRFLGLPHDQAHFLARGNLRPMGSHLPGSPTP